ncbi:MAG: hypothetical protein J7527_04210 [Chitinophagaceae bacterium]|nr:hypothetical protein [Chitinophagaceae bacterium]
MIKTIILAAGLLLLQSCGRKKAGYPGSRLHETAETIVDSIFQRDADSLRLYGRPFYNGRYWETLEVDDQLPANSIYKKLDSTQEIFSGLELPGTTDKTMKRSSGVEHYETSRDFFDGQDHYSRDNIGSMSNCKAYIKRDTLHISIGVETGFGGSGFDIFVFGNMYITMPYHYDDILDSNEKEPFNVPLWQKLVLNKKTYSVGDSLYGYVSFGSVFYNEYGSASGQRAKGFFRAKIKEDYR